MKSMKTFVLAAVASLFTTNAMAQQTPTLSADNIDKIATQRLGLVKVASGDESYLELNEDNQVILSQSKN